MLWSVVSIVLFISFGPVHGIPDDCCDPVQLFRSLIDGVKAADIGLADRIDRLDFGLDVPGRIGGILSFFTSFATTAIHLPVKP